jgi:hypothetical protein
MSEEADSKREERTILTITSTECRAALKAVLPIRLQVRSNPGTDPLFEE